METYQGAILAEVVHHVLQVYDLTQKVSYFLPFCIINLKSINMNFLLSCQVFAIR